MPRGQWRTRLCESQRCQDLSSFSRFADCSVPETAVLATRDQLPRPSWQPANHTYELHTVCMNSCDSDILRNLSVQKLPPSLRSASGHCCVVVEPVQESPMRGPLSVSASCCTWSVPQYEFQVQTWSNILCFILLFWSIFTKPASCVQVFLEPTLSPR